MKVKFLHTVLKGTDNSACTKHRALMTEIAAVVKCLFWMMPHTSGSHADKHTADVPANLHWSGGSVARK